jgi:hypothetical protein
VKETLHVRRAQEEIDEGKSLLQGDGILAYQATHDHDGSLAIVAFQWFEGAQAAAHPILSALPDDAGVQYHQVGLLWLWRGLPSQGVEFLAGSPGIGLIHLTANGPKVVLHGSSR